MDKVEIVKTSAAERLGFQYLLKMSSAAIRGSARMHEDYSKCPVIVVDNRCYPRPPKVMPPAPWGGMEGTAKNFWIKGMVKGKVAFSVVASSRSDIIREEAYRIADTVSRVLSGMVSGDRLHLSGGGNDFRFHITELGLIMGIRRGPK